MFPRRILLALAAMLAVCVVARPQETGSEPVSEGLQFGDEVTVEWVLVPVVVRSPRGSVEDLEQKDFELRVDGRPVHIESFHYDVLSPVRLVVLQDLSGSMGTERRLERSVAAVRHFLDRARPGDRFALGTFANRGLQVEVPLTDDLDALREAVGLWQAYGMTALHDAIAWVPRIGAGDGALRPAALLITDGVDNASTIAPTAAREIVRRAQIPVYTLGLSSGDPSALDAQGRKLHRYADTLDQLSSQTGGRYFPLTADDDIIAACREILAEIRHQYVLGFRTTGTESSQHAIEVRVRRSRDWEVRHRRGYTGAPPVS
ncbi:MAG: VWA domain-containing protein [Thermoanaerobaculia bacterium]